MTDIPDSREQAQQVARSLALIEASVLAAWPNPSTPTPKAIRRHLGKVRKLVDEANEEVARKWGRR